MFTEAPQRGKCDGVILHILEREKKNGWEKLRYCVNDQSGIWREHEYQTVSGRDLCEKTA